MKKQQQQQITINAYTMEVIQKSFTNTLRWLELYIEKSGYSGNWQRQIPEPIKRQDLNDQPSEIKGFMETALLAVDGVIDDKPDFILEKLQEQFYSWLDKSGIRTDNCPKELVECLININKVLTRDGKEFVERVDREASEDIAKMTLEERRRNFYQTFTLAQKFMDSASQRQKNLEGKTYQDIDITNKFEGSATSGQETFNRIAKIASSSSGGFQSNNPQNRTNAEIIQDVRQNSRHWRVDEIIVEFSNFGGTTQENVLIHQSANLDDYNQQTGRLNFDGNTIYRANRFSPEEQNQINQALNISQQSAQVQQPPYKWSWEK